MIFFAKTVFSKNLLNFEIVTQTNYKHLKGDVVTFNERLTAIGGDTRKVEVYEGGIWNDQRIPAVGNINGRIEHFTSLAIKNQLYVFGNISVYIIIVLHIIIFHFYAKTHIF